MKKLKRWFRELFEPNDLDLSQISAAFNDPEVRTIWLNYCFDEITRINRDIDKRLLNNSHMGFTEGLTDFCARRKAFQDILEAILISRRKKQEERHNPRSAVDINLDRVTV